MNIGVFDSGRGGLFILQSIVDRLPQYNYLYYGDTKNVPYGDKTELEIFTLTQQGVEYLFQHDCLFVIIACNSASVETTRRLQDTLLALPAYADRKILGVVIPTIEELEERGAQHALLLGTQRTVTSKKYERELEKRNITTCTLHSCATSTLAPLIEAGEIQKAIEAAVAEISKFEGEVDTVILGCTHYGILKNGLRAKFGEKLDILSQNEIIPKRLEKYLKNHFEIESKLMRQGTCEIYLTEEKNSYLPLLDSLLGKKTT